MALTRHTRMQLNLGPGVAATAENIAPMLANIPVRPPSVSAPIIWQLTDWIFQMGRACEPSDVAATVAFLASDDACYITGNVVEVDGGRCI